MYKDYRIILLHWHKDEIWHGANRLLYNRWQRRICTLSVKMYSDVTSVNLIFVSDKMFNNIVIILE